jgi:hypothetical protein
MNFFGGECNFNCPPFMLYVILAIIGIFLTAMTPMCPKWKNRIVLSQTASAFLVAMFIGWLCNRCKPNIAWLAVILITLLPIALSGGSIAMNKDYIQF